MAPICIKTNPAIKNNKGYLMENNVIKILILPKINNIELLGWY
jgi:hypothetical protein